MATQKVGKKDTGAQLATTLLPGQAEEDAELLDGAVTHINRLYNTKSLELYLELGTYLVETFFGGSHDNLAVAGKHISWRKLADREDLVVSHAQLWNAVRIQSQVNVLGSGLADKLSISHHRRLLAVKNPETKRKLAEKAANERLTVERLEAEVSKVKNREKSPKLGRPRLSPQLKALSGLDRQLAPLYEQVIGVDDVLTFGIDKVEERLERIDEHIKTLHAAKKEIQDALKKARG